MLCKVLIYAFSFPLVSYISYTFKLYISQSQPCGPVSSAFNATRLTKSAFLIKEYDDIYSEHPHIYAKLVPAANTLLLIDTGCGGASNDPDIKVTSLREFIETVGIDENAGRPLNEGGRMGYVVVLSHCHYDHILGVEHFAKDSPILASSFSPAFISSSNLPAHSLCEALGIRTPSYTPILVPHLHSILSGAQHAGADTPLGVTVLHTPGHVPDELALWDDAEKMLYVGDSLYEYEPIIFPGQGSIVTWLASLEYLISFVQSQSHFVRINSGHRTTLRPALEVLLATKAFMTDVLSGREKIRRRMNKRGETNVEYRQMGGQFSLICPERLVLEAREIGRTNLR